MQKPYRGHSTIRDAMQHHVRRWHAGLHRTLSEREVQYGIAGAFRDLQTFSVSTGV